MCVSSICLISCFLLVFLWNRSQEFRPPLQITILTNFRITRAFSGIGAGSVVAIGAGTIVSANSHFSPILGRICLVPRAPESLSHVDLPLLQMDILLNLETDSVFRELS